MSNKLGVVLVFVLILLVNRDGIGQQQKLMIYDLSQNSIDSILVAYDSTTTSGFTNYNIGSYNSAIENLDESFPTQNVFPNSQFTLKRKVADDHDITSFPIRTSTKLFYMENDSLKDRCSGSLISERHVLTAAHCFLENNTNNVIFDSLYVCPVYNNGIINPEFDCSLVKKVSYFKDWNASEDIGVLELEEPIGYETGWLGIGFNDLDIYHNQNVYYKFSYPSAWIPQLDSTNYTGGTLYYNYGKIDHTTSNHLGAMHAFAIPGESGSSIIRVEQNDVYRSYGVLSYSNGLRHTRINDWMYYSFEALINNNVLATTNVKTETPKIYPNPTKGNFWIADLNEKEIKSLKIYTSLGREVDFRMDNNAIDLSDFANGIYTIVFQVKGSIFTQRLVKHGS